MKIAGICLVAAFLYGGCHPQMGTQPRYEPYQRSDFYPDGAAMRPIPTGAVARGRPNPADVFQSGRNGDVLVAAFPLPVTRELVGRGRERFNIYCAVCHGFSGGGDGMIVQRGFPAPPSFHIERLREAPVGHFFDVITNGYGMMYPYGARVAVPDRWAIIAYIRAIQLSENASLADVPGEEREKLEARP
ncbi:MAG TPA: cytochrome c [Chthoniobacterales bacterium]